MILAGYGCPTDIIPISMISKCMPSGLKSQVKINRGQRNALKQTFADFFLKR
jgi:hypothetical protein